MCRATLVLIGTSQACQHTLHSTYLVESGLNAHKDHGGLFNCLIFLSSASHFCLMVILVGWSFDQRLAYCLDNVTHSVSDVHMWSVKPPLHQSTIDNVREGTACGLGGLYTGFNISWPMTGLAYWWKQLLYISCQAVLTSYALYRTLDYLSSDGWLTCNFSLLSSCITIRTEHPLRNRWRYVIVSGDYVLVLSNWSNTLSASKKPASLTEK